jgi:hypothetical protein
MARCIHGGAQLHSLGAAANGRQPCRRQTQIWAWACTETTAPWRPCPHQQTPSPRPPACPPPLKRWPAARLASHPDHLSRAPQRQPAPPSDAASLLTRNVSLRRARALAQAGQAHLQRGRLRQERLSKLQGSKKGVGQGARHSPGGCRAGCSPSSQPGNGSPRQGGAWGGRGSGGARVRGRAAPCGGPCARCKPLQAATSA